MRTNFMSNIFGGKLLNLCFHFFYYLITYLDCIKLILVNISAVAGYLLVCIYTNQLS